MLYWRRRARFALSISKVVLPLRKLRIPNLPLVITALLAVSLAVLVVGLELGRRDVNTPLSQSGDGTVDLPEGVPPEFGRVLEVWDVLQREHLSRNSLDPDVLSQAAVRGMLNALDDPYAAYLTPPQYSMESEDLQGSFEGIGAHVGVKDGEITIIAPIPDTPADRAGIRPGDVILEIDGESTEGKSLLEVVTIIRGPRGEPVTLLVRRQIGGETVSLTIVRDVVEVKSVSLRILSGRIAHLRITTFTESTDEEVTEALETVVDAKARGLIIDLRNNPGGLLNTVVEVTGKFLDGGLVLYEVDGGGHRKDWKAGKGTSLDGIPLVVLINEASASGSEVLAGALKDRRQITLIGANTFGKGSVNTLRALSDGSGLYFTIARWYTPSGTLLEGSGLEPDIEVAQPQDSLDDVQMDKAIEVLEAKIRALG